MKKIFFSILCLAIANLLFSQEISTLNTQDWNTLRYSGFYESARSSSVNMPNKDYDLFWGINIAHSINKSLLSKPYHWGGQIAFGINRTNSWPAMYVRSTAESGEGKWAKVLIDNGDQAINGSLGVTQNINAGGNIKLSNGELTYVYNDNFTYDQKSIGNYAIKWVVDSWQPGAPTLWQSGHAGIKFFTATQCRLAITSTGNVGIGTETPTQRLDINGNIKANGAYINGIVYTNEVKVEATKWADFVFDKNYKLPTLQEVENHINTHKHLPDIPSEKEVKENGVSLGEMQAKLLQKIEELTLYVIDLKKENEEQEKKMNEQNNKITELQFELQNKK